MVSLREVVEKELKEYRAKYGEMALGRYLNNFLFNLPSDDHENGGYYRERAKDTWEITYRESITKSCPEDLLERQLKYYSGLKLGQTPKEFFASVDRSLEEEGISIDEVKKFQHQCFHERKKVRSELCKLTFPAYLRLRQIGYSHLDLIG